MNTDMYMQPITRAHLDVLKIWGYKVIWPIEKILACKQKGIGAMENYQKIFAIIDDQKN